MSRLPKTVDPIKLGKHQATLTGYLSLRDFNRLQEILNQEGQVVDVVLQFGQDRSRVYFIKGQIKATVNLICQRCNQPMEYEIKSEFVLSPVISDAHAKKLPDGYEPVWMENDRVFLMDMIEDEILLALPMIAKHENDCIEVR